LLKGAIAMSIVLLVYIVSNLTEKSTSIILKERMSVTCYVFVELASPV